jgi:hypothetical protein
MESERHPLGKGIAETMNFGRVRRMVAMSYEGDGIADVILRSCAIASAEVTLAGPEACLAVK